MSASSFSSRIPLLIQGPTASGKSSLAVALARKLDGIVINVDSMQVYADLAVLTARPDHQQQAEVSHALYGYVDGAERYGVGQWLEEAKAVIAAAAKARKRLIFCGGTGLYAQALQQGLVETPEIDADVRQQVASEYRSLGHQGMVERLLGHHPQSLAHMRPVVDPQRLLRAAEVLYQSGKPIIEWQETHSLPLIEAPFQIVIRPGRERLYARINQRCTLMFDDALDEVAGLMERDLSPDLPLMRAIGVRTLSDYIQERTGRATALEEFSRLTRRYAKRQLTWLRHQVNADVVVEDMVYPGLVAKVGQEIIDRMACRVPVVDGIDQKQHNTR